MYYFYWLFSKLFQNPRFSKNLPKYTMDSITGTSQKSPIVVPRAATEPTPYIAIAVAIAISK